MLFYGIIDGTVLALLAVVGVSLLPQSPEVASLRRLALGFAAFQLALPPDAEVGRAVDCARPQEYDCSYF